MMETLSVLCVDCDGTLMRSDLFQEALLLFIKKHPFKLLHLFAWGMRGLAYLKTRVAQVVTPDPALLPYNQEVVDWLKEQKQLGRRIILVTASPQSWATAVAEHVGMFDEAYGSDDQKNLKGRNKLVFIQQLLNGAPFVYAGDHSVDLKIWREAAGAVLVNVSSSLAREAAKLCPIEKAFVTKKITIKTVLKAIRVHQYVKNALVFLPLLLSFNYGDLQTWLNVVLGFVALSFAASSVYLTNDMLDIESDRQHQRKCKRAFASGMLSVKTGVILTSILLLLSLFIAFSLPGKFGWVVLGYLLTTTLYSFCLKSVALLDVVVLAGLFTLRILAGMSLLTAPFSSWLLLFSMFFFLSLAFVKRYIELDRQKTDKTSGRGYFKQDMALVREFGVASGLVSTFVLSLYINSSKALMTYVHPNVLYFMCVLVIYWIMRVWLLAVRGQLHDDPVVFAIKDKVSYVIMLLVVVVFMLSHA